MSVYLDNAATTKPCREAIKAVNDCLTLTYGNPSSLHKAGLDAQLVVDNVRTVIGKAIAADPSRIFFTSGATESNNLAIFGTAQTVGRHRKKIVTTSVEHSSVSHVMDELEKNGFEVVRISPDRNGEISHEKIINAVDDNTCLVSMMLVNNETGYILPVRRAFYGIKRLYPNCITHCDAVQGFMKIPFKASELNADLISFSGHKIHGAKGAGGLYVGKGLHLKAQILGGGQENNLRSGTENVPMIAAMGAAVKVMSNNIRERYDKATELRDRFIKHINETHGLVLNSREDASPYIINISAVGTRSEIMLHYLESKEIYVSSGSACSKGAKSGVLRQFGLSDERIDSAIRVSLGTETTAPELNAFINAVVEGMESIRRKG